MARKIVFLEANEIPSRVLDFYMTENPDSSLSLNIPLCRRYETVAADTCALSPWITWPTLHRGVNNESHELLHFGQDLTRADKQFPPIWKLLMENGIRTGVFGPMHSSPLPKDAAKYDFFLPDTFSHTPDSHPDSLTSFQDFNLTMARNSPRNVSRSIDFGTLLGFLGRAPFIGLRPTTVLSILRQLIEERRDSWKSTRRRTYQPVLAFDLFMAQLQRKQPEFSNFFTNHVASAMHRYWAALFPEDFDDLELDEAWQSRYRGEISFAMGWTDDFFGRLVRFADANPEYLVVMASSMGQCASSGKRLDTQLYLRDPQSLMARAELSEDQWERRPAMDPTVSLYVAIEQAERFETFLKSMTIQDQPIEYAVKEGGFFDLVFGQINLDPAVDKLHIDGQEVAFESVGFERTAVEDEAGSTGYHIADGILTIYDPQDRSNKTGIGQASTTDLAPAILDHFGVTVPGYMNSPGAIQLHS